MNRAIRNGLAAALLGAVSPGQAFQSPPVSVAPYRADQIAEGVHLLSTPPDYRGGVVGNITIIEQSDGMVVVDSGGTAADGRRAVQYIRSITAKPVKALLFTHWHGDHPQGASEFKAAWPGLRIIATEQTRNALHSAASRYMGFEPDERFVTMQYNSLSGLVSQLEAAVRNPETDAATRARHRQTLAEIRARMPDYRGTHLVAPTEILGDELRLEDRLRPVHFFHYGRANTDGDAIAWLPKERIVVTGDIVVSPIPFGFFSFPGDWLQVLARIKALDYRILIPGHGQPQTDTVYIDRLTATLNDLRAQIAPLAQEGVDLEAIRQRVNFDAQRDIFGDTPRHRLLFDAYWLTPMTINTYVEARGLPMIQGDEALYEAD